MWDTPHDRSFLAGAEQRSTGLPLAADLYSHSYLPVKLQGAMCAVRCVMYMSND